MINVKIIPESKFLRFAFKVWIINTRNKMVHRILHDESEALKVLYSEV